MQCGADELERRSQLVEGLDPCGGLQLCELEDDRQQYIAISVRALTGTASLSTVRNRSQ